MKKEKDIFDLFRENQHKLDEVPRAGAWDKLERKLDQNQHKTYVFTYRTLMAVAASAIIVMLISVVVYLEKFQKQQYYAMNEAVPSVLEDLDVYSDSNEDIVTIIEFQRAFARRKKNFALNEGVVGSKILANVGNSLVENEELIAFADIKEKDPSKNSKEKKKETYEWNKQKNEGELATAFGHIVTIDDGSANQTPPRATQAKTKASPAIAMNNKSVDNLGGKTEPAKVEKEVIEENIATIVNEEPVESKAITSDLRMKQKTQKTENTPKMTIAPAAVMSDIADKELVNVAKAKLEAVNHTIGGFDPSVVVTKGDKLCLEIPISDDSQIERLELVKQEGENYFFENKSIGKIKSVEITSTEILLKTSHRNFELPEHDFWKGFEKDGGKKWRKIILK